MNRGMLWVALAMLVFLVWLGPASCLREDPASAESAEREAVNAEALANARPDMERYEAEAIITALSALNLTRYESRPTFWHDYLPAWPAGLRLKELSASDPEPAAPGVQARRLSVTLAVSVPTTDPAVAPRAPGGWQATMTWAERLSQRPDMRLNDLKLDTSGTVAANFKVWLLDPLPEPDPESQPAEETPEQ